MKSFFGIYVVLSTIFILKASTLPYVPYPNQGGYFTHNQWSAPQPEYVESGYYPQPAQEWAPRSFQHSGHDQPPYGPGHAPNIYRHLRYRTRPLGPALSDSYLQPQNQPLDVSDGDQSNAKILYQNIPFLSDTTKFQLPISGASKVRVIHQNTGAVDSSNDKNWLASEASESIAKPREDQVEGQPQNLQQTTSLDESQATAGNIDVSENGGGAYKGGESYPANNRESYRNIGGAPSQGETRSSNVATSALGVFSNDGGAYNGGTLYPINYYRPKYRYQGGVPTHVHSTSRSGNQGGINDDGEPYVQNIHHYGSRGGAPTQEGVTSSSSAQTLVSATNNSEDQGEVYYNVDESYGKKNYRHGNQVGAPRQEGTIFSNAKTSDTSNSGNENRVYNGSVHRHRNQGGPPTQGSSFSNSENQGEGYNGGETDLKNNHKRNQGGAPTQEDSNYSNAEALASDTSSFGNEERVYLGGEHKEYDHRNQDGAPTRGSSSSNSEALNIAYSSSVNQGGGYNGGETNHKNKHLLRNQGGAPIQEVTSSSNATASASSTSSSGNGGEIYDEGDTNLKKNLHHHHHHHHHHNYRGKTFTQDGTSNAQTLASPISNPNNEGGESYPKNIYPQNYGNKAGIISSGKPNFNINNNWHDSEYKGLTSNNGKPYLGNNNGNQQRAPNSQDSYSTYDHQQDSGNQGKVPKTDTSSPVNNEKWQDSINHDGVQPMTTDSQQDSKNQDNSESYVPISNPSNSPASNPSNPSSELVTPVAISTKPHSIIHSHNSHISHTRTHHAHPAHKQPVNGGQHTQNYKSSEQNEYPNSDNHNVHKLPIIQRGPAYPKYPATIPLQSTEPPYAPSQNEYVTPASGNRDQGPTPLYIPNDDESRGNLPGSGNSFNSFDNGSQLKSSKTETTSSPTDNGSSSLIKTVPDDDVDRKTGLENSSLDFDNDGSDSFEDTSHLFNDDYEDMDGISTQSTPINSNSQNNENSGPSYYKSDASSISSGHVSYPAPTDTLKSEDDRDTKSPKDSTRKSSINAANDGRLKPIASTDPSKHTSTTTKTKQNPKFFSLFKSFLLGRTIQPNSAQITDANSSGPYSENNGTPDHNDSGAVVETHTVKDTNIIEKSNGSKNLKSPNSDVADAMDDDDSQEDGGNSTNGQSNIPSSNKSKKIDTSYSGRGTDEVKDTHKSQKSIGSDDGNSQENGWNPANGQSNISSWNKSQKIDTSYSGRGTDEVKNTHKSQQSIGSDDGNSQENGRNPANGQSNISSWNKSQKIDTYYSGRGTDEVKNTHKSQQSIGSDDGNSQENGRNPANGQSNISSWNKSQKIDTSYSGRGTDEVKNTHKSQQSIGSDDGNSQENGRNPANGQSNISSWNKSQKIDTSYSGRGTDEVKHTYKGQQSIGSDDENNQDNGRNPANGQSNASSCNKSKRIGTINSPGYSTASTDSNQFADDEDLFCSGNASNILLKIISCLEKVFGGLNTDSS